MPIKLGKSKSITGSELIHINSCPEGTNNPTKKVRGIKQFFHRSKCHSKIPTGRSSFNEASTNNNNKTTRPLGKVFDNINVNRTESSPIDVQAIISKSVSPKLYTNSCASSIEELSKVALYTNTTCSVTSSAITCSPIKDVILEEDYEEALLLDNRTEPQCVTETEITFTGNTPLETSGTKTINQGIYNEPNDSVKGSNKDIIETCRVCQITPTNQFKEIRSRSGSDTDPVLVHLDLGVGSRCSTNSSIGSAVTLSDSPAVVSSSYSPHTLADTQTSPHIPAAPKYSTPYTNALSINVHTNIQSFSGPPTLYTNSPKGNTVICHHPSSPFSPPSVSKPSSSSNPSSAMPTAVNPSPSISPICYDSQEYKYSQLNPTSSSNIIPRRPGRFNKQATSDSVHSSGKQSTDGNIILIDNIPTNKCSEHRSALYSKQPVYEEAWDLKFKRMCQDIANQSSADRPRETAPIISSALTNYSSNRTSYTRPQSASGARRRTDSPGSKYASPPAVPPHRRSSVHIKTTHCSSFEDPKVFAALNQSSQSTSDCRTTNVINEDSLANKSSVKSHLKHNVNPSFDDDALTTDYDYAYNETWSRGVKRNMSSNLSNNSTEVSITQMTDSVALNSGYMDKIDSVDSEESSSLSTSQEATSQIALIHQEEEVVNIDNDSLSNDSYEEPWDVRHGRVISELTSARLIDPACVLSAHEQLPATRNMTSTSVAHNTDHQRFHRTYSQQSAFHSPGHTSSRQRSISGTQRTNPNTGLVSTSLINTSITLNDQRWYHENCSRSHSEQLMVGAAEGSFLVRRSETCRSDYSLTIRHGNDCLHMRISRNSRGFVLGQYSQPYVTIPHMLHHYSLTMVPVRGADSVMLKNPITR